MAAAVDLVISGPITRAHIGGLCRRLGTLVAHRDETVLVCDVGALVDPDAETIDTLTRLQLMVRRLGHEIRLRHASEELQGLLVLMGLCEVLRLESVGQAEEREQASGVEEEADPGDGPV